MPWSDCHFIAGISLVFGLWEGSWRTWREEGHRENMQTPRNKNSSRYGNQTHNLLAFQGYDWPVSEFRISSTHQIAREFYRHWQKKNQKKNRQEGQSGSAPPPHVTNVTSVPRRKRTIQKQKKREFVALAYRSPSPACCRGLTMKDISKARVFGHWCRRLATDSR